MRVDEQLDKMADRLTNARGEVDAASVFLEQAPSSLRHFGDFVTRLSLSKAKSANWVVIAVVDPTKQDEALAQIKEAIADSSFEFRQDTSATDHNLFAVQTAGIWQSPILGSDLSGIADIAAQLVPTQRPNDHKGFVEAGLFMTKSPLFPNNRVWVFQHLAMTENTQHDLPTLYVVRGFNIERLKEDAELDPEQAFTFTAIVKGRADKFQYPVTPVIGGKALQTRTVLAEPFSFILGLSPPPSYSFPRLWILSLLIGLAGTALAFSLRFGRQAIANANSLVGTLRETRTALDDTRDREATFFENTGTANCETDATTGKILRVNRAMCDLFGYSADELVGKSFEDITHPDDVDRTRSIVKDAKENADQARQFEKRYLKADGSEFWALVQTKLFVGAYYDRSRFLTTIIDISERKAMEVTKNNLVRELAHRVRNTVQLTASMARQTAKSVRNVNEYDSKFRQRLAALSAAQDVLFDAAWSGADLSYLAKRTLAPFESDRLRIDLVSLHLPTQHAQTFAIALHELASNSIAFGALGSGGTATFAGEILEASGTEPKRLHLKWHETGVKSKSRGRRQGFGHMMLFKALPGQFGGHVADKRSANAYTYECWLNLPSTSQLP
jgi:PAS domain S-box-containing protein